MDEAKRCAALYRVSSARQVHRREEEDTIPLQRVAVREFLRTYHPDWQLVAEWAEEGVSAYRHSSEERDVLREVLHAAARGQFDVLLVFKADRLSRRALEYPAVLAQLRRFGVVTIAVQDQPGGRVLETDGQYEKLVRFLEGWQAEMESYNTSVRVTEALRQKGLRGEWRGGRAPYGYRLVRRPDGRTDLATDPVEAEVVRYIFHLYVDDGWGVEAIARLLRAQGVPTRGGRPWYRAAVRRILLHPVVTGRIPMGMTRPGASPHRRVRIAWKDWDQLVLGPYRPELEIVSRERWEHAVARMRSYNRTSSSHHRGESSPFRFSGLLQCGTCGGPLIGMWRHRQGRTAARYVCRTHRKEGRPACPNGKTYACDTLEDMLLQAIMPVLWMVDRGKIKARALDLAGTFVGCGLSQTNLLRRRLDEARRVHEGWVRRLDEYLNDPASSPYSEKFLATKVREWGQKVHSLQREYESMHADGYLLPSMSDLESMAEKIDWKDFFLQLGYREQKQILSHLVERVVVGTNSCTIVYRFKNQEAN